MSTTTAPSTTAAFPPVVQLSPADAREVLRQVQASVPVELPPAQIDDRAIPGGPTGEVSIWIVRPADTTGMLPVVFHSRGGGWILGDKDTYERLDCELANQAQAVVVFVDYTRHSRRTTRPKTSRPTPRCTGPSPAPPRSAPTRPGSS